MKERIGFVVDGNRVVGDLFRPAGPGPHPGVVVAGPMTSVKEQVAGVYAVALAVRGIAALAIDHRHYGESEGEPRQLEHSGRKVEDLVAAFDWLGSHPAVDADRRAFVGVCLGSSYAACAAVAAPGARALATVAAYFPDPVTMRAGDPEGFEAEVETGRQARRDFEVDGTDAQVPAASVLGDGAPMTKPDVVEYYATGRAGVPNYRNSFAVMSREPFLLFDPHAAAPSLRVPTLFVHAPDALMPEWAQRFAASVPGPTTWRWLDAPSQTAFYDRPDLVDTAADHVAHHVRTSLAASR